MHVSGDKFNLTLILLICVKNINWMLILLLRNFDEPEHSLPPLFLVDHVSIGWKCEESIDR